MNPVRWLREHPTALIVALVVAAVAAWGFTIRTLRSWPVPTGVVDLSSSTDNPPEVAEAAANAAADQAAEVRDLELRPERRKSARPTTSPALTPPPENRSEGAEAPALSPTVPVDDAGARGEAPRAVVSSERVYTYSHADVDVQPPAVVTPNVLGRIPGTGSREDSALIEVVVNERGEVDAVKALDVPRSLGDAVTMTSSLSAAKSWRFHPATKDGRPVRYRQQLLVALR